MHNKFKIKMHRIIYSFVTVLLMGCMCLSSCKSKEDKEIEARNDSIRACAQTFADSFFNMRYRAAVEYCTPRSRNVIKFIASNVSQDDLATVAQDRNGASVAIQSLKVNKAADAAEVRCRVSNFLNWDSIGVDGRLTSRNITLQVVKSNNKWKVDLENFLDQLR